MIKLHDEIPATPDIGVPDSVIAEMVSRKEVLKGEVVYIHPLGRFYTLRFTFPGGSWTESRPFTEAEKEAGRREGLFPGLKPRSASHPSRHVTPFGYAPIDDFAFEQVPLTREDDEDDLSAMF